MKELLVWIHQRHWFNRSGEPSPVLVWAAGIISQSTPEPTTFFISDQDRVVVRVASTYIDPEDIRSRLLDCRELAAAGAPILSPLADEVVLLPGGRYASFWPLAQSEIEFDGHELATVLNACHRLQPPDRLMEWTPDLFVDRRWATLKEGVGAGLPSDMADSLSGMFTDALGPTQGGLSSTL